MAKQEQSTVLAALQQAAEGLVYTSESEDRLEAFLWEDGAKLTRKHLLELAGAAAGTRVEESSLEDFLHAVPPEDRPKFDRLARVIGEQLSGVKVYKVGDEAEKEAYVVGKTGDGRWAGLKTTVVET
jgi:histidine triad (HIT) family protein